MRRNPDPEEPADWPPWPQADSGGQKSIDHTSRSRHAPVSPTGAAPKSPEKRCRVWCRGARLGAIQFSSYCRSFPLFALLHSCSPGTGRRTRAKSKARKRKETLRKLRSSWKKTAFFNACRSGEAGIRTLGTPAGTPVFKTGGLSWRGSAVKWTTSSDLRTRWHESTIDLQQIPKTRIGIQNWGIRGITNQHSICPFDTVS